MNFIKILITPDDFLFNYHMSSSREFLYLSFVITKLKIGLVEKMRKNDIDFAQNGPREPPGAYLMSPNQGATRTYQTPFTE